MIPLSITATPMPECPAPNGAIPATCRPQMHGTVSVGFCFVNCCLQIGQGLVIFSGFADRKLILYNDAPAPFPDGEDSNDYFPGAPQNPTTTTPGFGPNTRQIMRFKVIEPTRADPPL